METTAQMPAFGTETILLVDDEELVRSWGDELLTQVGYTVITAANGKEALEAYKGRQAEISLVILDLIMPEMGGKQCIVELLKLNPKLKILVSSGYPIDSETRKFLEVSAKGIVPKPFKVKDLLQAVRSTLDEP
jgi:CheY-like chemotaxis protein